MQLLLIRHGESEADLLDVHEGRADFPLTERGQRQAEKMAAWVTEHYKPDRLLVSTLQRARMTAEHLAQASGCEPEFWPELMEYNNGARAGLPMEEGFRLHPDPVHEHERIEGGESRLEFRLRAEAVWSRVQSELKQGERVAIVAHGWMITQLIRAILEQPPKSTVYYETGDTGIHLFEWNSKGLVARFMNSTAHLAGEEV
ncbi:MAG TPA: histidine phosphatase family protein [Bacilli bacterium]|nr:histidine phosphatase family protein [Bacilli bacterium]